MWGWNILNHNQFESTNNWIFPLENQAPSTASVRERRIAKTTLTVCATSISKDTHFLRRWLLRFFLWFWDPCIIMRNLTCPRSRQCEHAKKVNTSLVASCGIWSLSQIGQWAWQWTPNWLVFWKSLGLRKHANAKIQNHHQNQWNYKIDHFYFDWLQSTTIQSIQVWGFWM